MGLISHVNLLLAESRERFIEKNMEIETGEIKITLKKHIQKMKEIVA
jgi:hypothetical protein